LHTQNYNFLHSSWEKWTDKTYADNTTNAWNVNLNDGNVNNDDKTFNNYHVWPVRAGE